MRVRIEWRRVGLMVLGWLALTGVAVAEEVKTIEILPHIWTVHSTGGTDSNATFIITDQGVMVIDTSMTPEGGRHLRDEILKKTGKPITHVVNTHHHKENVLGNNAFKDCASIIAHRKAQKNMEAVVKHEGLEEVTFPNLVFDNHVELTLGGYLLELRHPGPAHTNGDLYVYMPTWRTIIAGGLVFNEVLPDTRDSYIDPWIDALQKMEDVDAELIVPGHGRPGGKQLIMKAKHYLILLKRYVNFELDQGHGLNDIIKNVSARLKEPYGGWLHPERMEENIRQAFIEYSAKRGT